jgi:hypothetical protein
MDERTGRPAEDAMKCLEAEVALMLGADDNGFVGVALEPPARGAARRFARLCADIREDRQLFEGGLFRLYAPAPMRRAALGASGEAAASPLSLDAGLLADAAPFLRDRDGRAVALMDLGSRNAFIDLDVFQLAMGRRDDLQESARALRSVLVRSRAFAHGLTLVSQRRAMGSQNGLSTRTASPFPLASQRVVDSDEAVEAVLTLHDSFAPFEERFWRFEVDARSISRLLSGSFDLSADILQCACGVEGAEARLRSALGGEVDGVAVDRFVVDSLYPHEPDAARALIALIFEHRVVDRRVEASFSIGRLEEEARFARQAAIAALT